MADISDVQSTLVSMIGTLLYPNGSTQPSLLGSPARIYAGWPVPANLDADLTATPPMTNVSVYPAAMNRNTTRYLDAWQTVSLNPATLALVVAGVTVTVAGTIPAADNPQNLTVFANGKPYTYQATVVESLASCALKLGALIAADLPNTTVQGATIVLPDTAVVGAVRVGVTGVSVLETRRQEQVFQIGIWAAAPQLRDLFAKTVDGYLAAIRFFTLPDQSACRLIWKSSTQSDKWQKQALYRRDLFYTTEYATFDVETQTQINVVLENDSAGFDGIDETLVATIYE